MSQTETFLVLKFDYDKEWVEEMTIFEEQAMYELAMIGIISPIERREVQLSFRLHAPLTSTQVEELAKLKFLRLFTHFLVNYEVNHE